MARKSARQQSSKQPYSKPVFSGQLVLRSEFAKYFGLVRFDRAASSLFLIDVLMLKMSDRVENFDHKVITELLSQKFDKTQTEITSEIKRMEDFLSEAGITQRPTYTNPLERSYTISSPEVARFAKLIEDFDHFIQLIDTAWLTGQLDTKSAENFRSRKKSLISKLIGFITDKGYMAQEALTKLNTRGQAKPVDAPETVNPSTEPPILVSAAG